MWGDISIHVMQQTFIPNKFFLGIRCNRSPFTWHFSVYTEICSTHDGFFQILICPTKTHIIIWCKKSSSFAARRVNRIINYKCIWDCLHLGFNRISSPMIQVWSHVFYRLRLIRNRITIWVTTINLRRVREKRKIFHAKIVTELLVSETYNLLPEQWKLWGQPGVQYKFKVPSCPGRIVSVNHLYLPMYTIFWNECPLSTCNYAWKTCFSTIYHTHGL